jgi:hypothetical protein
MAVAKERQISVRVSAETDRWLERQAGGSRGKASFVRDLIERERIRQKQQEHLEMFNRAASDLTEEDRAERELLIGAFSGPEESGESE